MPDKTGYRIMAEIIHKVEFAPGRNHTQTMFVKWQGTFEFKA